jgi:hypothetical protein
VYEVGLKKEFEGSNSPDFLGRAMIEKRLRDKIEQLIARASGISDMPFGDRTEEWKAKGEAWVTEAVNAVELAVPDYMNAYRRRMVTASQFLIPLPERVPVIASLLRSLLGDIDAGLVGTFKTKVQAETFDNFLDHAVAYHCAAGFRTNILLLNHVRGPRLTGLRASCAFCEIHSMDLQSTHLVGAVADLSGKLFSMFQSGLISRLTATTKTAGHVIAWLTPRHPCKEMPKAMLTGG